MMYRILLPLLIALAVTASAVMAEDRLPPLARQALHKAQIRMDAREFVQAAAVLRDYMADPETTPVPAHVHLMLGSALHQANTPRQALDAFRAGLRDYPDNPVLLRNCAVACYETEQYKEAARLFERAYAASTPPEPALLFHAGSAYYGGEDYAASARVLARLLKAEPHPQKDWVRLAVHAHLAAGLFSQTETILRRYLAANPGEAPYWELLAKLHMDRRQYAKAAGALEICYRLREPSAKELERLASLYAYSDAPLLATAALRRIKEKTGDRKTGQRMAALYASAGRTDLALTQLSRQGPSGSLAEQKGRLLYQARRFDEAATQFTLALGTNAKSTESRFLLGMCAWEHKDWSTAKANFQRLRTDKAYARRVQAPLMVIKDIETARRESE